MTHSTISMFTDNENPRSDVAIKDINVPDLWHVAQFLGSCKALPPDQRKLYKDMVLLTWHMAHDMKKALQDGLQS